jgi:tricorn protease
LKQIIFCISIYLTASAFTPAGAASPESTFLEEPAQSYSGMVRFPDANKTNIVFVYAGDLWLVPRSGGLATRLTNSPGSKRNPRFSPDGQTIAFTGIYNGIYTIPVTGGAVNRITHNPGDYDTLFLDTGWAASFHERFVFPHF